jgi:cell volume regulation protein A
MAYSTEILLIGSVLLFFSLFWERFSKRFEVPVLFLFLIMGMLVGSNGLGRIHFSDPHSAHLIGMLALAIILFSGGMDAKFREVKPVIFPSVMLSTLGVLLTALFTGLFIYWITTQFFITYKLTFFESLLLASVIASTDFALVFAILRSKGLKLKHNLRPLLELESGSNDVMAYLLMITFLQLVQTQNSNATFAVGMFFYELVVGALCGFFLGKLAVKIINRVNMSNDALYPILLLAISFIIFLLTDIVHGSGFLAVYLGGLTIGNSRFLHKRSTINFFDGFAWLAQFLMFFTFGMLIKPAELIPVAGLGLTIGFFIILLGRPLSVLTCIPFFKKIPAKAKLYVSWVGLRGAVPLIFATYILASDIEHARVMFNVVFFIMLTSLLIQGTSVSFVARLLKLGENFDKGHKHLAEHGIEFPHEIKTAMTEIVVQSEHLKDGNSLVTMNIPEYTMVVMVRRREQYFVPKGNTEIEVGDILYLISNDERTMRITYRKMGISY